MRIEASSRSRDPELQRRRVVLDCDTGTDDAIAIMLAALHPQIELLGVSAVWGNHAVENTADNSLRVFDHIGRAEIAVFRGEAGPLSRAPDDECLPRNLPHTLPLPATSRRAGDDAVGWLVETVRDATEPVTLVATGPLTNVAAALRADPALAGELEELVVMGGTHAVGNVTPSAERNIWSDAQAATEVLQAGIRRVVLVPLDATHEAAIDREQCAELRSTGTPAATAAATFIEERIAQYGDVDDFGRRDAAPVHDPLTVAYLVQPDVVELRHVHVAVETRGALTYGRTVIDLGRVHDRPPNAHMAVHADRRLFFELLRSTLGESRPAPSRR